MFYTNFEYSLFYRYINRSNSVGTILYIHGLGESGLCFESQIQTERLYQWSHIVLDLEGYGKSLWPVTPKSLEQHADRVSEWLQLKSISPVIIFCHSMGGVIGLILCEKYPELVQGFINAILRTLFKEGCDAIGIATLTEYSREVKKVSAI